MGCGPRETRLPRRSSTLRVSRRSTARGTSGTASPRVRRASIRSIRRSSGCAASSGSSRRVTGTRASPSRSRTTSTFPGAGRRSGFAARLRACATARCTKRARSRELPLHKLRGTDPNWRFAEIAAEEREHGARGSTFYVLAGHGHRADGAAPEVYDKLRPKLVEELLESGSEVGLHGSYLAAEELDRLAAEAETLRRSRARSRPPLPLPPHRPAPEPRPARLARLPLRHDARLLRRARLPRRHRASVPAVGLRAGGAGLDRRGAARRDGCDARRAALSGTERRGREAAAHRASRLGGGTRRRLLDPLASRPLRRSERARLGQACTSSCSTRSASAAASARPPVSWLVRSTIVDAGERMSGRQFTHRQILVIYAALAMGMLLAALDQTIVVDRAPDDRRRPRRPQPLLVGRHGLSPRVDDHAADLRQARRPLRAQADLPDRDRDLPRWLGAVRAFAEHARAHRASARCRASAPAA